MSANREDWNEAPPWRFNPDCPCSKCHAVRPLPDPKPKRKVIRRKAKVIDMQEWLAARGRGPERRRPRTTGDS
jgi:hypothetical protein